VDVDLKAELICADTLKLSSLVLGVAEEGRPGGASPASAIPTGRGIV
jgi:hypothetical protein